eukprot:CAMPEP_0194419632 /NCGR_PEP_ID=MMETSP0176-20130528/18795_1 /TAXON_ID=216777 /ORGANISM="Proboscia alata, Strain PI-D3" /LENGTH=33 /DNA_ID= /DNA_START= /DNA_END= /DNA_ORIENTATION=
MTESVVGKRSMIPAMRSSILWSSPFLCTASGSR